MAAKAFDGERHRVAFKNNTERFEASAFFDKAHDKRNICTKGANCTALGLCAVYMGNRAFCLFRLGAILVFISSAGINVLFDIRKVGSEDSGKLGIVTFRNIIRKLAESCKSAGTKHIGNNGHRPDSRIEKL